VHTACTPNARSVTYGADAVNHPDRWRRSRRAACWWPAAARIPPRRLALARCKLLQDPQTRVMAYLAI